MEVLYRIQKHLKNLKVFNHNYIKTKVLTSSFLYYPLSLSTEDQKE